MARTPDTEAAYLKRAKGFERAVARKLNISSPDPRDIAAAAIHKKHEWTKSTWRQIKASLIFYFEIMDTPESLLAITILEGVSEAGCKTRSNNTSGRRKKEPTEDDLMRIFAELRNSRSSYAGLLEIWMRLGILTGLRPHEWQQAKVVESVINDNDEIIEGVPGGPFLRVVNSKNTNGRAHGKYRHLDLSECDTSIIKVIRSFSKKMNEIYLSGQYKMVYAACSTLLMRINRKLFGKSEQWVQLYTARHCFTSNAKLSASSYEIAAMMGHATNKTAGLHYGKVHAASGSLQVKPVAEETMKIRDNIPEWTTPARLKRKKIHTDTKD